MIFAAEQFKKEFRNLIGRWKDESDLSDNQLIFAAVETLNDFNEEEVIEFEPDPDFYDTEIEQEGGDDI